LVALLLGHVFLGILDVGGERHGIEALERHGVVGEHGEAAGADLGDAAANDDRLARAAAKDGEDPRPQRRHQWRMAGENAHVALGAGQVDLIHVAGEQHALRGDEIEVKCGHWVCPEPDLDANSEWGPPSVPIRHFTIRPVTPPRRVSCYARRPARWCRPYKRPPRAGGRICPRTAPRSSEWYRRGRRNLRAIP